jgi:Dyp-type peroxidase family
MMTSKQLQNIQANIFKGHGRKHAWCLFVQFKFNPNQQDDLRRWISQFSGRVSPAFDIEAKAAYEAQLKLNEEDRQKDFDKKTVTSFLLSANGYRKLGYSGDQLPGDRSFRLGMKNGLVNGSLGDPPSFYWESYYRHGIDAMIILANKDEGVLAKEHIEIATSMMKANIGTVLFVEKGNTMSFNHKGPENKNYVEHFGYRDGISNPEFKFDPQGNLDQGNENIVLVEDHFGGHGSYLVYRKLEQNVRAFNQEVAELAKDLGITKEYAEAQIMGRFKDGTPLEKSHKSGMKNPEKIEFDFKDDEEGARCPFHAHIRKVNPRIDAIGKTKLDIKEKQIVRRGITYGRRTPDLSDEPETGVGLLFMCYQKSITNQFEYVQKEWCNKKDFISPSLAGKKITGIDPVCGVKVTGTQTQRWNTTWLNPANSSSLNLQHFSRWVKNLFSKNGKSNNRRDFSGVVTLKGGEYFYSPPISFLKNLPRPTPVEPGQARTVANSYASFNKPMVGSGSYYVK